MLKIEEQYKAVEEWFLDTIKEEKKLVRFYQKLGYVLTGSEEVIHPAMTIVDLIKKK